MTDQSAGFVYVTYIRTTPQRLFEAITTPGIARRYWGHENVSADWQPGSDWQHVRPDAARTVDLVGKVLAAEPPHLLVISWASASQQDDPVQFSRVTFRIEPQADMVRLTVTHEDLQPGSSMLDCIGRGWPLVLSSLKSFLETGAGLDLSAA